MPYVLLRSYKWQWILCEATSLQTLGPAESSAAAVARPAPTFAPRRSKAVKEDHGEPLNCPHCVPHTHIHVKGA